jgi:hypothetical protein
MKKLTIFRFQFELKNQARNFLLGKRIPHHLALGKIDVSF